jgi:hypothetical protein
MHGNPKTPEQDSFNPLLALLQFREEVDQFIVGQRL